MHEDADLFVEAPASYPAADEEIAEVELANGARVLLLSAEDMLVYRLEEFVGTGHREAASQAASLLGTDELDRRRLERRTDAAGLRPALAAIEDVRRRIEDGEIVESWELQELAGRLRRLH